MNYEFINLKQDINYTTNYNTMYYIKYNNLKYI